MGEEGLKDFVENYDKSVDAIVDKAAEKYGFHYEFVSIDLYV